MEFKHKPVMLEECIEGLNIKKNGVYVDGTLGGAGHSLEIAKRLNNTGLLIGIDRDEEALKVSKERLSEFNNIKYIHGNHDDIKEILGKLKIEGCDRNSFRSWCFFIPNRCKNAWFFVYDRRCRPRYENG